MKLYAVMNHEGLYLRSKGYGGYGNPWVDTIEKARIYPKEKTAKAQITFWAKNYSEYPIPSLVVLKAEIETVINQETRVNSVITKQAILDTNKTIKQSRDKYLKAKEEYESLI